MDVFPCSSFEELLAHPGGPQDVASRPDVLIVLLHEEPSDLSDALLRLNDLPGGSVIAPITSHHWKRRPLFLISIPKSGTHLMYELVSAFGYGQGGNSTDNPNGQTAYFINSMNPHTSTTFLDFKEARPTSITLHAMPSAFFLSKSAGTSCVRGNSTTRMAEAILEVPSELISTAAFAC